MKYSTVLCYFTVSIDFACLRLCPLRKGSPLPGGMEGHQGQGTTIYAGKMKISTVLLDAIHDAQPHTFRFPHILFEN